MINRNDHQKTSRSGIETAGGCGGSRTVGGVIPHPVFPPQLLTGGLPSSSQPETPMLSFPEVPEFSHGGYDGGIEIGFDATWNDLKFPGVVETLEEAKEQACAIQKGPEGFAIELAGEEVLVMPMGAKVGGLLYKYRFLCRGIEFLVHSNPPKGRQPVRVRYLAESLIGQNFFVVHEQFVMPFLKRLGLTVYADKPSRIDMQVLIDVPSAEFCQLFESGHVVTKLRKFSIDGSIKNVVEKESLTLGSISKVQVCIYDKSIELRSKKTNAVKEAFFVERCVGDEWFNSDRSITRIEIRLGRKALKCLGVNTVADLKQRERGIVTLVTREWIRFLAKPKVRGTENTAAIHPVWERVCELFQSYFSGAAVKDVKWEKNQSVICDPEALEKQGIGCLSKALAYRYGEQSSRREAVELGAGLLERNQSELLEKLNGHAEHVRIKTGITLGSLPAYDAESEYMQNLGMRKKESFSEMFRGAGQ